MHFRASGGVVSMFTLRSIKHFIVSYHHSYSLTTSEVAFHKSGCFLILLQFKMAFFSVYVLLCSKVLEKDFLKGMWLGAFCVLKIAIWCKWQWKTQTCKFFVYTKMLNKWKLPFPSNNKVFVILHYVSSLKSITVLKCIAKPHDWLEKELMSQNFTSTHSF